MERRRRKRERGEGVDERSFLPGKGVEVGRRRKN
jgi:hypothetical protein